MATGSAVPVAILRDGRPRRRPPQDEDFQFLHTLSEEPRKGYASLCAIRLTARKALDSRVQSHDRRHRMGADLTIVPPIRVGCARIAHCPGTPGVSPALPPPYPPPPARQGGSRMR